MTYTEDQIKRFRVWGEFHNYPTCCIDWFCNVTNIDRPEDYDSGAADGTGFLPCPRCSHICKTDEGLCKLLGRDIKCNQNTSLSGVYEETLEDILTDRYKSIADKYEFDYTEYLQWVDSKCYEFKIKGEII